MGHSTPSKICIEKWVGPWLTLNVNKSSIKGGRGDVEAPFWSWDTVLSGTFGPKWLRESLSPRKWYFRVTETSGEWTFLFRLFFCISFLILRRCGSGKERVAVAANLNPPPKLQSLTDHLPIRAHIIRAHIRLFTKYCHSSSNPNPKSDHTPSYPSSHHSRLQTKSNIWSHFLTESENLANTAPT